MLLLALAPLVSWLGAFGPRSIAPQFVVSAVVLAAAAAVALWWGAPRGRAVLYAMACAADLLGRGLGIAAAWVLGPPAGALPPWLPEEIGLLVLVLGFAFGWLAPVGSIAAILLAFTIRPRARDALVDA